MVALSLIVCGCRPTDRSDANVKSVGDIVTEDQNDPLQATASSAPPDHFIDVTSTTEVKFSFQSGRSAGEYAIIESLGGGVAAFDYDLDGNVDLMFAGGGSLADRTVVGRPCGLFRNLGSWSFRDSTGGAATEASEFYNHGVFPGDFNSDGLTDLAISGYGGVQLLRNQGDGTFESFKTLVTHESHPWSTSLAWADFNGDGHLDLYVTHYVDWSWENHPHCRGARGVPREVCAPREFRGVSDVIYFNDGNGDFRSSNQEVGLVDGGKGLGVVAGDINLDGATDLYVANDTTDNFLYLNDGQGKFRESAILAGVSGDPSGVNTGSMGVALQDLTNDGMPDLWVTNFERELFALYRNDGSGLFSHISRSVGLAAVEGLYVGFGTVLIDLNLDGHLDIVVSNGHVSYHSPDTPFAQQPLLLMNRGDGRFLQPETRGYFAGKFTGRGLAYADLDNDGSWDLVFTHLEEPAAILQGATPPHPRWALVQLVGRDSNRDAVGATVRVLHGQSEQLHCVTSGSSYLSHSDRRLRLLLPDQNQSDSDDQSLVEVRWPSGIIQRYPLPSPTTNNVWVEGHAEFVLDPTQLNETN
ncbi:MAG TPA: hypothetical protein DDZ51_27995 [Planctomycetaceae bacterium]|nr:hypothetical protein [Planctomycetaceae bacterium]